MRSVLRAVLSVIACLGLSGLAFGSSEAGDRRALSLSAGRFGMLESDDLVEVRLEYRHTPVWDHLRPVAGFSALDDGGKYFYGGMRYEWNVTERLQLAPGFAAGIYAGNSIDMGGPLEFRSGLDVNVALTEDLRLGVEFYHLSNSRLYDKNGGSESLVLSLTYAF